MPITYHNDLIQGSDEWHAARCGRLTASEMKLILTPTLKIASAIADALRTMTGKATPELIAEALIEGRIPHCKVSM